MPELPANSGHDNGDHHDPSPAPGFQWQRLLGIVGGAALIAVLLILHLTGVLGPGRH